MRFLPATLCVLLLSTHVDLTSGAPYPSASPLNPPATSTAEPISTAILRHGRLRLEYFLEGHHLDQRLSALTTACIEEAYHRIRGRRSGTTSFTGVWVIHPPIQVHLLPSVSPPPAKEVMTNDEAARVWLMLHDVVVKEKGMKEMEFDVEKEGIVVARGKVLEI